MGSINPHTQFLMKADGIGSGKKDGVLTKQELRAYNDSLSPKEMAKADVYELIDNFDKANTTRPNKNEKNDGVVDGLSALEVQTYISNLRQAEIKRNGSLQSPSEPKHKPTVDNKSVKKPTLVFKTPTKPAVDKRSVNITTPI